MIVLIRGGDELASGIALRLHHVGFQVVISEIAQPQTVRRKACFAEAAYAGEVTVEGVTARRVTDIEDTLRVLQILSKGRIGLLIDPEARAAQLLHPSVIVDARMRNLPPEALRHNAKLYVGLGSGFTAPDNCHAVIETQPGRWMGRVIWQGSARGDTSLSEAGDEHGTATVLRAPTDGVLTVHAQIGDHVQAGQLVAEVEGQVVRAPIEGGLCGLLHPDVQVSQGSRIGEIDPRNDPELCGLVSDQGLAIGGAVLEAILA